MCLFVGQIWAQIPQGARLVTGNLTANYKSDVLNSINQSFSKEMSASVSISGSHCIFIKPNLSRNIGFSIGNKFQKYSGVYSPTTRKNTFNSLGFSFNYGYTKYFPLAQIHDKLFFTLSSTINSSYNFQYRYSLNTTTQIDSTIQTTSMVNNDHSLVFGLAFTPGIAFQLKEKWLLSANFGTAGISYSMPIPQKYIKSHSLNADFNLKPAFWGIGIGYFLSPKS